GRTDALRTVEKRSSSPARASGGARCVDADWSCLDRRLAAARGNDPQTPWADRRVVGFVRRPGVDQPDPPPVANGARRDRDAYARACGADAGRARRCATDRSRIGTDAHG